jgi:magnesium transporter
MEAGGMRITLFDDHTVRELDFEALKQHLASGNGAVWVDMLGPSEADLEVLRESFDFHPLAIEDTYNQSQRPKAEEFKDHLFIITNPRREDPPPDDPFRELDVFVGPRYLVTVHPNEEPVLERARQRLEPGRAMGPITSTYLLWVLLDTIVDDYEPMLEKIEDELDELGTLVFASASRAVLSRLFDVQQLLIHVGRVLGPQQDVMNLLVHHQLGFLDHNIKYYMRDIQDHVLRANDRVRALRETVNSLLNLYISAVSNRLNRNVNRLTVFAVIVGSLTVISGFYGMNFVDTWPPFSADWGVPAVMLMMVGAVVTILLWLRRQR